MTVIFDPSSNLHPYECGGMGKCEHCDRRIIEHTFGERTTHLTGHYAHHPAECALCAPSARSSRQTSRSPTCADSHTGKPGSHSD